MSLLENRRGYTMTRGDEAKIMPIKPMLALPAPVAPKPPAIRSIADLSSLDDYLREYGGLLGRKAVQSLRPLHIPGRNETSQDFSDIEAFNAARVPFPAQADVVSASVQMFNRNGSGFVCGEMGTGKTIMGQLAAFKHASQSRGKGGYGGRFRCLVLCPDHLIAKWKREIEETVPDAQVVTFGPMIDGTSKAEKRKTKKTSKTTGKETEVEESKIRQALRDTVALIGGKTVIKTIDGDKPSAAPKTAWVSTGPGENDAEERPLTARPTSGKVVKYMKRWAKPAGPVYYVLGRNMAKWMPNWDGICENGKKGNSRNVVLKRTLALDDNGQPKRNEHGNLVMSKEIGKHYLCPKCGSVIKNDRDIPESAVSLRRCNDAGKTVKGGSAKKCRTRYMEMVHDPDRPKIHGKDRICPMPRRFDNKKPGCDPFNHAGYKWIVKKCGEPLYNFTSTPYRWSLALIIQRKLKRMFDYMIIDEVHEHKSDESAQSMACGKMVACVDHVLALTGTIIGGYANHLYPLMMRITPKSLRDEGFEWGKDLDFTKKYGRIDRIITTREDDPEVSLRGNVKSMRKAKATSNVRFKAVPGVMPAMFARHMIGSSIFITLEEMADELPDLYEYIGGSCPPLAPDANEEEKEGWEAMERGWVDCAVDMEPEQRAEYQRIMAIMELTNRELLVRGSTKFLSAMLWTGLDYPDRPFGWGHDPEITKAYNLYKKELKEGEADNIKLGHTVGYWDKPGIRTIDNWVGVLTPKDLSQATIYPKEQRLIDICLKQKADGTQTWVYVQMTGKRNIQPRLKALLESKGLKVGILRSDDVEPMEREAWIAKNGRDFDVMISHPQLVSTGLDLFSKSQGGHNYSAIVFYETGYNAFTMRQAARRAWRISQPRDCRVYYMFYRETMQHKAMVLMSKKIASSLALEGEFSADGLAAMAGEDNLQMALAKNLADHIDDSDMQRSWSKIKSAPKKTPGKVAKIAAKKPGLTLAEYAKDIPVGPLDSLPIEVQIVVETIIEDQAKPMPAEAVAAFAEVRDTVVACAEQEAAERAWEQFGEPIGEAEDKAALYDGVKVTTEAVEGGTLTVGVNKSGEATTIKYVPDPKSEPEPEPEPKEVILRMPEPPVPTPEDYDSTFDEELDDNFVVPELTQDLLAKMFANLMEHGIPI